MPRNTPLRNRVKELRERLNVRQSELAREAGVTRQTIIAIEKGRLNPSILISLKIAKMLREPVDYIFYLQPGFDYEQEARENAGRPKRGRKKRTPVSSSAGPAPVVDSASYEAERDAAASDADEPEEAVIVEAAEPERSPTEAHDGPVHDGAQKGEDAKSGQAIWDFF
jgi:putative transcriptional regulator